MAIKARLRKCIVLSITSVTALLGLASVCIGQTASYQPAEWARIVAAASKEGKVLVYSALAPAIQERVRTGFSQVHPNIAVEITRYGGTGVVVKLDQEREAKATDGADVGITYDIAWIVDRAKSNLIKGPAGPSTREWPSSHMVGGVGPVLATEPFLLAYNTKLVATPITGYQDLLRPEFKGKIGTVEAVSSTVVAWYDWLEKTQGAEYLQKLAAQNPRIHGGGAVQNAQSVAAGETLVTSFTIMTIASPLVDQGAPIKMVLPSPSLGTRAVGAVPAWATRPNAALVFLDFLMSVRGQTLLVGRGEAASALPNVPGAMDGRTIAPYDPTPYTPDVVKTYLKRWNAMFTGK